MVESIVQHLAQDWPVTVGFTVCGVIFIKVITIVLKQKAKSEEDAKLLIALSKEVALLSSSTVGMGQRMIQLQVKLDELLDTQSEMNDSEAQFAYTQALRLLEQGADSNTVAANCGLSKSEIQLMQLVHGQRDTA